MEKLWTLLTHLHSLAGPSLMLLYPLYASVMALESTSKLDDEQWLAYWVLYSFLTLMEMALQPLLEWIPIWYNVKLVLVAWLVLPQFKGATFLYERFVREKIKKYGASQGGNGKKKSVNFVTPNKQFLLSPSFLLPPFLFYKFCISILDYFVRDNLTEKVVLITGASSGIGEHLAYEYARRGACLALAARRENQLREVVDQARQYGSPDVIMIVADVCKVEDCKRLVDETVNHFGRLDHLVNNAGITSACMFEDSIDITDFRAIMDTNFWGSVYTTRFAVPHLRNSQGRIIVMSSGGSWLPIPRMSIYNASKAALLMMFDTLRIELGPDVKITIVTPGFIESELTQGKLFVREGKLSVDQELRDVQVSITPVGSVKGCAKAIVNGACKGQRYLTEPAWYKVTYIWRVLCPEMVDLYYRLMYLTKPGSPDKEAPSKKILDLIGAKKLLYPETILSPDVKVD